MNRRDLLRGASAFALSAGLPAPPGLSYLPSVVAEWGCDGLVPVTATKAQMDAYFARWSDLTHFYANSPGVDIAHLPGAGLLNDLLAIPSATIPAGMTDWRQATSAEIIDDINRALWEHDPLGLEEPR